MIVLNDNYFHYNKGRRNSELRKLLYYIFNQYIINTSKKVIEFIFYFTYNIIYAMRNHNTKI